MARASRKNAQTGTKDVCQVVKTFDRRVPFPKKFAVVYGHFHEALVNYPTFHHYCWKNITNTRNYEHRKKCSSTDFISSYIHKFYCYESMNLAIRNIFNLFKNFPRQLLLQIKSKGTFLEISFII